MRGYIVLVKQQLALVISGSFLRKRKGKKEKGVTETWHQERACISKFLFLAWLPRKRSNEGNTNWRTVVRYKSLALLKAKQKPLPPINTFSSALYFLPTTHLLPKPLIGIKHTHTTSPNGRLASLPRRLPFEEALGSPSLQPPQT